MKRVSLTKSAVRHDGRSYPVVVQSDESGGYWVNCPVFEGCYSQGETMEEALQNIREAILLCEEEVVVPKKTNYQEVSLHFVSV